MSRLLIHSHLPFRPFSCYNKKCSIVACKICCFLDDSFDFVKIKNFVFPIFSKGNCNAKNAVYIIRCKVCNIFYIGQTENIKSRLSSHISNIKNFIPFSNSSTVVSCHFSKKEHDLNRDFRFIVFKDNIEDSETRIRLESQLINLIKLVDPNILNEEFPQKKGITCPFSPSRCE